MNVYPIWIKWLNKEKKCEMCIRDRFETVGTAYDFIALCCKMCRVELAHKRAEIDAMPNGGVTLSVYTENDIETCRDVLFYVAQVLGGFFLSLIHIFTCRKVRR